MDIELKIRKGRPDSASWWGGDGRVAQDTEIGSLTAVP